MTHANITGKAIDTISHHVGESVGGHYFGLFNAKSAITLGIGCSIPQPATPRFSDFTPESDIHTEFLTYRGEVVN